MKNTWLPSCRQWLAMAAARWVLPQPLGPLRTNHPLGSRAKCRATSRQRANLSWFWGSLLRPRGSSLSKVRRVSGPRLLYCSSLARRPCSNSFSVHWQGANLPKSGCPKGTSKRNQPLPLQRGHSFSSASTIGLSFEEVPVSSVVLFGVRLRLRMSPMLSIVLALRCPSFQNARDISPITLVEVNRFSEGVFNP